MELSAKMIKYSKEKRSKLRNEEKALQEELQELDRRKPWKNMNPLRVN